MTNILRSIVLVAFDLNHSTLISWQDLHKLRVIPASCPAVASVARRMKIYLKDNSVPYCVSAPRPIPLHFQEPVNSEIAKHIASGIIVPCDEPTNWCSPAFFVPKGNGKRFRLVTDYTKLNQFVVRPVNPFPSVSDII